jgi:beta-1,4-mannosyl-glycoprotein beta-1,4-N-acetylglucosaminyltransferase
MKVIDCFTFYNELDMLEYRLSVLYPHVSKFILVEATLTHAGIPKPLFYQENKERYARWADKIVHVVVEDMPDLVTSKDAWVREIFQRNAIDRGITTLDLRPLDILIVSDVDEIPNPTVIDELRKEGLDVTQCLEMDFYYYTIENRLGKKWKHAKVCPYADYVLVYKRSPNDVRLQDMQFTIPNAGWHLGYFGTPEFIQNKLKNFAHQEFNTPRYTSLDFLKERMSKHMNLFDSNVFTIIPPSENPHPPPNMELLLQFFPV